VNKHVLKNSPGNCTLTNPEIQKQIIQCCALETRKKIVEGIVDEPYAILADESSDISHRGQARLVGDLTTKLLSTLLVCIPKYVMYSSLLVMILHKRVIGRKYILWLEYWSHLIIFLGPVWEQSFWKPRFLKYYSIL
jgi:hypothetical protein